MHTSILNNIWISKTRGIRQRYPLLVLLFALEVEIVIFKDKKE